MQNKLSQELSSFQDLWRDGYFEGDPLNPMAKTTYGQLGFMSALHATYLRCIKPYIKSETVSLEIGPGRGAWTKSLLPSKEVYALDAVSEEDNRFFQYLGHPKHVQYFQVKDFKCKMLPDEYFDYMFSFGCLCHVSFEGIKEYAFNLYPKLKKGSNCFWLVADYAKYNRAISHLDDLSIWTTLMPKSRRYLPLKWLFMYLMKREKPKRIAEVKAESEKLQPGRWHNAGIEKTCAMLKEAGYQIIDPDVGTCLRDPIIHFIKP